MSFLQDVVKEIGNEYASLVSDGVAAGDTSSFIDTGSYIFNGLVSGSIYGGIPGTRSQLLQVSQVLAKHFSVLALYSISSNLILMLALFILSLKVQ